MSVEFLESNLRARFDLGEGGAHHAHFAHIFGWLSVDLSSQFYNITFDDCFTASPWTFNSLSPTTKCSIQCSVHFIVYGPQNVV